MQRVVIMGAGGRDFHNFNVAFRDDCTTEIVAFTAAQIPGIDDRRYPFSLAGPLYPNGIPIRPESELADLIAEEHIDEVVLAYSDLSHEDVMHKASLVLAHGADFRLLGLRSTMLESSIPVIAVCAARTGCGKSQTSRYVAALLREEGLRPVLVRHPMPYGDLEAMRVQRFASLADIDASNPTVEEREEYEEPVRAGIVVFAGVDYEAILREAEAEADVIIWDGGNNDWPFYRADVLITVVDPLRAGHEIRFHPGEVNVRSADIVLVNKVDSATPEQIAEVTANVRGLRPEAAILLGSSPVSMEPGPAVKGRRIVVVEDGPTITHGGMAFGAGTVAALAAGAGHIIDPRPYAFGSIGDTYEAYPHIGAVLPAMGYGDAQLKDLAATIAATGCDVVVSAAPMDLARLIDVPSPIRRVNYELALSATPSLRELLRPVFEKARR